MSLNGSKKNAALVLHPLVKWAGGKTSLLSALMEFTPPHYECYYEPFVGGAALLFRLRPRRFAINDINRDLVALYSCFDDERSYLALKSLLSEHQSKHCKDYYYRIRSMDRDDHFAALPPYERAARLIYLNKACFNGLYRVNNEGHFNVPFGHPGSVKLFDEGNFACVFTYFHESTHRITNADFGDAVKDAGKGDFVYFDPPYDEWDGKKSFSSYDKSPFGKEEQKRLATLFRHLAAKGVYVMLSNHNTTFIRELYKPFYIHVVPCRRAIAAKAEGRAPVEEVIITSYATD